MQTPRPCWSKRPKIEVYEDGINGEASGLSPLYVHFIRLWLKDTEGTVWTFELKRKTDEEGRLSLAVGDTLTWAYISPSDTEPKSYLENSSGSAGRPAIAIGRSVPAGIEIKDESGNGLLEHRFNMHRLRSSVETKHIEEDDIRARVYQSQRGIRPLIVVLPGSGGGMEETFAPALANVGYTVLTPALFAYDGRPDYHESIDLNVITRAVNYASLSDRQPLVLMGTSRGAEAAIMTAALTNEIASGVIGLVPGAVITPGWTPEMGDTTQPWLWNGKRLPFFSGGFERLHDQGELSFDSVLNTRVLGFSKAYRAVFENPVANSVAGVPIQNIDCPALLISAGDDLIWDSEAGAEILWDRLPDGMKQHPASRLLSLEAAGHLVAPKDTPCALSTAVFHGVEKQFYAVGGTPTSNAVANRACWEAILSFLERV